MSRLQQMRTLREGLEVLQSSDTRAARRNSIPVAKNTGYKHYMAVAKIVWELVHQGVDVICEARFTNGARADIYAPELRLVLEVLDSESKAQLKRKYDAFYRNKTPVNFGWCSVVELETHGVEEIIRRVLARSKGEIA